MPIIRFTLARSCVALAVLSGMSLGVPALASGEEKQAAPDEAGRYIVTYDSSGADAVAGADVPAETRTRERALGFDADLEYKRALKGFAAELSAADVQALRDDPEVARVTPDLEVHALSLSPLAAGESVPTGVARMEAANEREAHDSSSVAVAVLDTGIDLDHPDLVAQSGTNCVGSGAAEDDNGHGTHVAGTIGALNQGTGVVGVAPGTKLYAVKVLDSRGSGLWSNIICGLDWVTANAGSLGIKVANMSLGGLASGSGCTDDPLHEAVCNSTAAGVVYTVAAGNDGWDWGAPPPDVPASFPEVLTVTAIADSDGRPGGTGGAPGCRPTEIDDKRASFSNFSRTATDTAHSIAAPGVCIRSTWPGGGYATMSGTSMAAPHAAGLVALCMGEGGAAGPCKGISPAQVIQKVRADAEARATAANGFLGDPLQPLGRYFGYLSSAAQTTGLALRAPDPKSAAPASPAPATPSKPAPTCIVRRTVYRHRHVIRRRTRAGRIYRTVRIHRHVRRHRICF